MRIISVFFCLFGAEGQRPQGLPSHHSPDALATIMPAHMNSFIDLSWWIQYHFSFSLFKLMENKLLKLHEKEEGYDVEHQSLRESLKVQNFNMT